MAQIDIAACTTVATVECSRDHFKLESSNGPQSQALCMAQIDIAACTTVATVECSRGHFKLESSNGPQSQALCMAQIVTLKPRRDHKIEDL